MGLFNDVLKTIKPAKKPEDEDYYETYPDDNVSEEDQLTMNKLIRERTRKGKRKMVEVEE